MNESIAPERQDQSHCTYTAAKKRQTPVSVTPSGTPAWDSSEATEKETSSQADPQGLLLSRGLAQPFSIG